MTMTRSQSEIPEIRSSEGLGASHFSNSISLFESLPGGIAEMRWRAQFPLGVASSSPCAQWKQLQVIILLRWYAVGG
jgi:hypothetical protein